MDLPRLRSKANQEERRKLLLTMLDAVYVDAKKTKSIIAIRPKPPFKPVFQVAASRKGSDIHIINEPLEGSSLFLVETGESRTIPETTAQQFIILSLGFPIPTCV
jgi:site-specific DNA recombinase